MLQFIEFLRAAAVMLITNSHFDGVYPVNIATGGELGNAIFFMITGYLLANIKESDTFPKWYGKKLIRLYIPVLLFTPIELLLGRVEISSLGEFLWRFVWPTTYWFVGAMAILYAIYYFLVKYAGPRLGVRGGGHSCLYIVLGITTVIFCTGYALLDKTAFNLRTNTLAAYAVWFLCMILGLLLRKGTVKKNNILHMALVGIFAVLYAGSKVVISRGALLAVQFIPVFASVGFALNLFVLFMNNEALFTKLNRYTGVSKTVKLISKNSLEIYIVQQLLIWKLRGLFFPVNLIVICLCVLLCGGLLRKISSGFIGLMMKESERQQQIK